MNSGKLPKPGLLEVRAILDQLRAAGLSVDDIAHYLKLHQVQRNPRAVRHWFSGKTNIREVERRALIHLLNEVNDNERA